MITLYFIFIFFVLFFKQKTAYEMRISDWSSDVCSSDLMPPQQGQRLSDLVGHRFDFGAHCSSSSQLGHPPALRRRGCSCLTLYRFGGVSYRPSPPCCHPRQASVSERDPGHLPRLFPAPSLVPGPRPLRSLGTGRAHAGTPSPKAHL